MASNWPPAWLNQRPGDPDPSPSGRGQGPHSAHPQEAGPMPPPSLGLPMPPAGIHPEMEISQQPLGPRWLQEQRSGRSTSNMYMPTEAPHQSEAPWASDIPQHRTDRVYPPPSAPTAGAQDTWLPTEHREHVNRAPAAQEDIALLLELQYAFPRSHWSLWCFRQPCVSRISCLPCLPCDAVTALRCTGDTWLGA